MVVPELPQFTYTKFVVVVDSHINVRDPRQVIWAIAGQVDPQRDLFVLENTPFDSLDFASEQLGLGGRMAIDATTKIGPEKNHDWGEPLQRPAELEQRVTERMAELGLDDLSVLSELSIAVPSRALGLQGRQALGANRLQRVEIVVIHVVVALSGRGQ